jgi:glycosyltransferase involved in cell wall biosynthesis
MRILLACELYDPSVGGVQEVTRQLAERLVLRGHVVTVATSYLPDRRLRNVDGVAIEDFKVSGNSVNGISGQVDAYRSYVLASDYDVIMVTAAQQWTFDALVPVLDRIRKPKVFLPCGFSALYEPAYAEYYRSMPDVLRSFDHLIFNASDYRDVNMAKSHGLANFSIVPNGADEREFSAEGDPAFRSRYGIGAKAFLILTVGTLTGGMKGHLELAKAFAMTDFGDQHASLLLNGNHVANPSPSGLRTPVRVMRAARSAVRRVRRTGAEGSRTDPLQTAVAEIRKEAEAKQVTVVDFGRSELIQAYLNSDLFVFASNIEYSPLVLYEAAAAGLPFLTVPVGNAAEIAEWTGGGVVCPAPRDARGYTRVDPAVLALHIGQIAADRGLRHRLGEAGHGAWQRQFTWDRISREYEAIFADIVRKSAA